MKTLKELLESLENKFKDAQGVDRQYTSAVKVIRKHGVPGELDKPSKISDTGGNIPAGYSKFRASALVWPKAPGVEKQAPQVGDYPSEFDRATKVHDKFEDDINRLYRNLKKGKGSDKDNKPNKIKEDLDVIDEAKLVKDFEPPYVLILKRQTVKSYPNNIKVALYYSDKLNKYISIPYGPNIDSSIQVEDVDERTLVSNIINIFYSLSEDNKIKMIDMINKDSESYSKVREFILENAFDKTNN